jgi:HEAT repeat protein
MLPRMPVNRLIQVLALLLACSLPCEARQEVARSESLLNAPLDRAGLEQRNARVSFSAGAAERGREILLVAQQNAGAQFDLPRLANALMCVGAGGELSDLGLLESYAERGKLSVRRAALFAIGELGIQGYAALERLLARHLVGAEEVALLALIRMDQESRNEPRLALQRVLDACNDERPGVSQAAFFLREYALGGPAPAALPALEVYFELRWSAACAFGFVDGLRWRELKLNRLLADPGYLNRFVLGLVGQLDQSVLSSHLIELLAVEHAAGCAAGIIAGLPGMLATLYVDAGWRPASVEEWEEVIAAIEGLKSIDGYVPMLRDSLVLIPNAPALHSLRLRAAVLLLAAGEEMDSKWTGAVVRSTDSAMQTRLLEIAGDMQSEFMLKHAKQVLKNTKSQRLGIEAQVALSRMGEESASKGLRSLLGSGNPSVRLQVLQAMVRVSHDPEVRKGLGQLGQGAKLSLEEQYTVAFALVWTSPSTEERQLLRDALLAGVGDQRGRMLALKILLVNPEDADFALCRELFPQDDQLSINLLLSHALVDRQDSHTLKALRSVLWGSQWNLSVMAGGISQRLLGTSFLLDELARPPVDASDSQLRSVGFALGEWAGLTAVEELARTHSARDPALQGAFLGALSVPGR